MVFPVVPDSSNYRVCFFIGADKKQRTYSITGLRPSISFTQMRDELHCEDANH